MKLPFHIAKHLGVIVIYESLGEIAGYYHEIKNQKIIHVDESQSEWGKDFVLKSLLRYALLEENELRAIFKNEIEFIIEHHEQTRTEQNRCLAMDLGFCS